MGSMRSVLLVVLLCGCGVAPLTIANGTALGVSSAALACDWSQTRAHASDGWMNHYEDNAILGTTPSPRAVDAYFAGALVAHALAWYLVPERYRSLIPTLVLGVQLAPIAENVRMSGLCGFDVGRK